MANRGCFALRLFASTNQIIKISLHKNLVVLFHQAAHFVAASRFFAVCLKSRARRAVARRHRCDGLGRCWTEADWNPEKGQK